MSNSCCGRPPCRLQHLRPCFAALDIERRCRCARVIRTTLFAYVHHTVPGMPTAIRRCFAARDIEDRSHCAGVMGTTPHFRRKQCRFLGRTRRGHHHSNEAFPWILGSPFAEPSPKTADLKHRLVNFTRSDILLLWLRLFAHICDFC